MEKEIPLSTRVKTSEAKLLKKVSENEFMSVSAFIRKCAINKAKELIEKQNK